MSTSGLPVNAFINRPAPPGDGDLAAAPGPAKAAWGRLLTELAEEFDVNVHEWRCHPPRWGWAMRVKREARTIVWLRPCEGGINVLFILGAKAMEAARRSTLPRGIVAALDAAPKYPEGTGLRLHVKTSREIGTLRKLAAIRLAN